MGSRLKSADGFYGWVNLAVLFFFNIVFIVMMLSFALFLPSWVEEFSWSRGDMSLAQFVAWALTGLAAPIVGIFIMKKGVKTNENRTEPWLSMSIISPPDTEQRKAHELFAVEGNY